MAYLEIKGIHKSFNNRKVLHNINLEIEKSSFVSLLGLSGCGKTTLLRIIAGLEQADSGEIFLDGKNISTLSPQERNIGIVFQNYALFPHMNVFENVAYGLKIKKLDSKNIQSKVAEVLEKVKLHSKANQNVSILSGGEQQRVAFARAIVMAPQMLLMDEPLSNLDHSLRLEARNEIKRLQNDLGITSVYVTHDQGEALAMSDKIAMLDKGEILQMGSPDELYFKPNSIFSAEFIGRYNLFDAAESLKIFNIQINENQRVAILPEHLIIKKEDINHETVITDVLFTGVVTEYVLRYKNHSIKYLQLSSNTLVLKKGDTISLDIQNENIKIIG